MVGRERLDVPRVAVLRGSPAARRSRRARWPGPSAPGPACRTAGTSASGPARRRTRRRSRSCRRGVRRRWRCAARPAGRCPRSSSAARRRRPGAGPTNFCTPLATGEPCASMPTASMTASGPAAVGELADERPDAAELLGLVEVRPRLAPCASTRASRSGTRSTEITRSPACTPIRAAMSPIGPAPSTSRVPPSGTSAYFRPAKRSAARRRGTGTGRPRGPRAP